MAKINKKGKIKSANNPSLLKIKLKSAEEVSEFAENIINTVRELLLLLDKDLRVVKASQSFYDFFKVTSDESIGTLIYDLGNGQWNIPKLRELLEKILLEKTTFDNFEVEHVFSTIDKRIMLLNARKIKRGSGKEQIILAIEDITELKQAEEALQRSELRFRTFYENAKIGLYRTNPAGTILMANKALVKMLGYPSFEKIVERNLEKDIYEPTYQRKEFLEKIEKDGEINDFESVWVRQDGSEFFVRESAQAIRDSQGTTLYYDGMVEDITERKRAGEEVQESEERFRMVFENVFDGISIYNEDPDPSKRRLIECNERYSILAGRSRDELLQLGSTLGLQMTLEDKANINRLESIDRGTAYQGFFSWIRPDGKENVIEYVGMPITWRGKSYTIGIDRDITERKRAEEEIVMLAQSLRSVNESVSITDMKDKLIFVNQSFLNAYGYSEDELIGKQIRIVGSPNNPPELIAEILSAALRGGWKGELRNKRKDGSEFPIYLSTTIINDKDGKPLGLIGVATDITERKRTEQELIEAKEKAEEMNRLKSNFLANMSHELRTPLIGINGYADFLRQDIENPELKEMAEIIFNSGTRLSETLNLILDLSKFESEKMEFSYQKIDVVSETEEIIMLFKESARKKELYLKTSYNQTSIFINTDERAFRSILNNLINNAIKFTNEGGVVADISLKDNFVEIRVIDTGIGISKEYQDKIYEEYRQVSEGYTRKFEGAGLGLNITKKLVEKFGGEITVNSEPGKGSTFIVKLPVNDAVAKTEQETVIGKANLTVLSEQKLVKPLALLVDDDPLVYPVLKRYTAGQIDLESTPAGEFAVKLCGQKQYDYIFMDINLCEGMGGKQATQVIRKIKGFESIPIIATTAYAMVGDKEEFLAAGCSHYLSKPFGQQDILNLLEKI